MHEAAPEVALTVVGEGLSPSLARHLAGPLVRILGHVPDLAAVYAGARLAVAPLRFGAGVKGKVLEAWSHGLPCVMTPIAAEGLPIAGVLSETVAKTAEAFAALIVALHGDKARHAVLAAAARRALRSAFSQKRTDEALAAAVAVPRSGATVERLVAAE